MKSDWQPSIECWNPSCILGKLILLPYSNLQEIVGNRPDWPKDDWRAFVVCRQCGTLGVYSKGHVRWGLSQDFGLWKHTSFLRIELKCDQKSCGFPIAVHMLSDKLWRQTPLERKLQNLSDSYAVCHDGHPPQSPIQITNVLPIDDFGSATL